MTPPARTRGTRVELYGRETLPTPARGRREQVADRLAALVDAGAIAACDVFTWPKRIPRSAGGDATARDRYLAVETWAMEAGVSLGPGFQTRECYSMETGERGDWVVLPALCLVVYEDDQIAAVYPHGDGDTTRSVLDGIASLDAAVAGDDRADHAEPVAAGRAD